MKKHFKEDCKHCNEYPHECDICCGEVKASINLKSRYRNNKKRDFKNTYDVVYNN